MYCAAYIEDEPVARITVQEVSGLTYLPKFQSDKYALIVAPTNTALADKADGIIKELKSSGELERMEEAWFGDDERGKTIAQTVLPSTRGILRFGTVPTSKPFTYMRDGEIIGYEIDLAARIADALNLRLVVENMDFASLIPALIAGKVDMAGGSLAITEERGKSVRFLESNYEGGVVAVVRADPRAGGPPRIEDIQPADGVWANLKDSFERTFIAESRWKLVLRGLWVTMLISLASAALGTVFGILLCAMRRSEKGLARFLAVAITRTLQGMPIVVLLMIFYYIIFGSVDIPAVFVAILAFSLNFAAYVSEMFRTGIDTVDKGQVEASTALGFNKWQTYANIVFPQAARHVLPVYKGEFISMVKMTAVVGYIAVQDLTKMSDIIRSRTYDAFFPLVSTAILYFCLAYVFIGLLNLLEIKVDPKRRRRVLPGVRTRDSRGNA